MHPDRVAERFLLIVAERTGADRALLVLDEGGECVAAEAISSQGRWTVELRHEPLAPAAAPVSLLRQARLTGRPLLVNSSEDPVNTTAALEDEYVARTRPGLVLCYPLERHGNVLGALCIERKDPSLATPEVEGLEFVKLLAPLAAAALETSRARNQAEKLAKHLQLLLDNASLGIAETVYSGTKRLIQRSNPAHSRMLGYEPGELIGQETRVLFFTDEEYDAVGALYRKALPLGKAFRGEVRYRRKDGSEGIYALLGSPLDPGDLHEGVVWLTDDITEQKRAEAELQHAKVTAERAERAAVAASIAKSRFLAAASHDLRQPMHALDLYLGYVASCDLPELVRPPLENARQCARTMDEMFRALLDISKLDSGTVRPEVKTFTIGSVLDEVHVQFSPEARAKGLDLRVVHPACHVRSDPALVKRIICNFIANAVRYTSEGRIVVGCRRKGMALRVAVHDTGPGIDTDKQEVIFDEFYQIGNPERDRAKGLGLGLAIVRRLARLLDVRVTVVSKPGRGSMFAIELPLVSDSQAEMDLSQDSERSSDGTGVSGLGGKLVAVIDDEASILDATRTVLEQWGCSVVTAASGAEALARFTDGDLAPDVIVCDFRLREHETGVDVVRLLRQRFGKDIPALIVTGDTASDRIREIEATSLTLMHKPIAPEYLKRQLEQLIAPREFGELGAL